ncbi:MAG: carbohydrate kinase [Lentisphaerae bacterium]|nr:carbohydrate kinase [Lentisphaerota bacterium]
MKYIVGIDEGTTGCKTCVFDEQGKIVASSSREYPSYYPKPGYVEQDIHEIKNMVFESCREAISKSKVDPANIVGVSHSNQGITMVLVDVNEKEIRNRTIGWQDTRHVDVLRELKEKVSNDDYFDRSGMSLGTYNIAVLNWLQKHEAENWGKVSRICSHQDYFLRQLGADGYFIDEGSANFMSMLGVQDNEWNEELMSVYNVKKEQLPTVVHEPGTVVGYVTEDISKETGLPVGCAVALGGLDTNCSSLAAGAADQGTDVLIVGTAGVSIMISDREVKDPNKRVTLRSNPGFGNWQLYLMTNTAASSFRWFRDSLCSLEVAASKLMGADPYDIMTSIASNSIPGANGVTALTCLQGSHGRRKNESARGTFLGVSLGTSKADIAQAILEGITFEMKDILSMKENIAGNIKNVRLCGGVAKSEVWCQMFADILQKPIELTEVPELGSLGAAMCAGIGAGLFKGPQDAVDKCVHIVKTFHPNPDKTEAYQEAFERWNTAYDALIRYY